MSVIHFQLRGKRIFMVEDNPANIATAKIILERQGAIVGFDRWCDNLLERLEKFMPIDIILMDLMFPNHVTGYELFDLIRSFPTFAHIPMVAVSASDASEAIPLTRAKGFAGYIAKPLDFDHFPKQIAQILEGELVWNT